MSDISASAAAVLAAVRRYLFDEGFPPTLAEIGAAAGIPKQTAKYHVGRLVAAGELRIDRRRVLLPEGQNPHELVKPRLSRKPKRSRA